MKCTEWIINGVRIICNIALYFLYTLNYTKYMNKLSRVSLGCILTLTLFFITRESVDAQTSFSVEPAIIEMHSTASDSASIIVNNLGSESLTINVSSILLIVSRDGTLTPRAPLTPVSGITPISNMQNGVINIPAGSKTSVEFSIQTKPSPSAIPGLLFTTQPLDIPEDKTVSAVSGGIVVPILQRANPQDEHLMLRSFKSPSIAFTGDVPITIETYNPGGNITFMSGSVVIKNILGQEVNTYPIPSQYVLPKTSRVVDTIHWSPKLLIGIYSINLEMKYGNSTLSKRIYTIGFPVKYAGILIVAGLIGSGVYLRVKKYRA